MFRSVIVRNILLGITNRDTEEFIEIEELLECDTAKLYTNSVTDQDRMKNNLRTIRISSTLIVFMRAKNIR